MTKTHIPTQATPAKGLSPQELGSQSEEEVRAADTTRMSQIFAERNANNPDGARVADPTQSAEEQLLPEENLEDQKLIQQSKDINAKKQFTVYEQDIENTAQKLVETRRGVAIELEADRQQTYAEAKQKNAPMEVQTALFQKFVESGYEATSHQAKLDRQKSDLKKLFVGPSPFELALEKQAKMHQGNPEKTRWAQKQTTDQEILVNGGA